MYVGGPSAAAIDTVAECEAETMVMKWTQNTVTRSVTGLSASTTYYFNVLVRDAALNKAFYAGKTEANAADTTAPTAGSFSTSTNVSANSLALVWSAGTDVVTSTANCNTTLAAPLLSGYRYSGRMRVRTKCHTSDELDDRNFIGHSNIA